MNLSAYLFVCRWTYVSVLTDVTSFTSVTSRTMAVIRNFHKSGWIWSLFGFSVYIRLISALHRVQWKNNYDIVSICRLCMLESSQIIITLRVLTKIRNVRQTQKYYCLFCFCFLWRCGPMRAMASSFLRFLDHIQRRITVGRTPLDEWSARRRDLYLTTH